IIRVTQPIRNISATVMDFDGLTGEAAIGLALTTSSRGTVTVSCSRTAVFICLSFPSLVYDLQFASNLYLSLLPNLLKTGNYKKCEPWSDQQLMALLTYGCHSHEQNQ